MEPASGRGGGDPRLIGVVWEGEVGAADQDVDEPTESGQGHGGAFRVPAGSARAPRAGPRRVVMVGASPEGHVERIVPSRVTGLVPELGETLKRVLAVQTAARGDLRAPEVHRAVAHVGAIEGDERGREPDDVLDVVARPGHVRGRTHGQRLHVLVELVLLDQAEGGVVRALPLRGVGEHVVDIRDVARELHREVDEAQNARQRIGPHEGGRVAEVGHVVGRDPADVDPGRRREGHETPVQRRQSQRCPRRGGLGGARADRPARGVVAGSDVRLRVVGVGCAGQPHASLLRAVAGRDRDRRARHRRGPTSGRQAPRVAVGNVPTLVSDVDRHPRNGVRPCPRRPWIGRARRRCGRRCRTTCGGGPAPASSTPSFPGENVLVTHTTSVGTRCARRCGHCARRAWSPPSVAEPLGWCGAWPSIAPVGTLYSFFASVEAAGHRQRSVVRRSG